MANPDNNPICITLIELQVLLISRYVVLETWYTVQHGTVAGLGGSNPLERRACSLDSFIYS